MTPTPSQPSTGTTVSRLILALVAVGLLLAGSALLLMRAINQRLAADQERVAELHLDTIVRSGRVVQLLDHHATQRSGLRNLGHQLRRELDAIQASQQRFAEPAFASSVDRLEEAYRAVDWEARTAPRAALGVLHLRALQLQRLHHVHRQRTAGLLARRTEQGLWQLLLFVGLAVLFGSLVVWRILSAIGRVVAAREVADARMRAAVEGGFNEFYIGDLETLSVEYANQRALTNTGYSLEELRAGTVFTRLLPDVEPSAMEGFLKPLLSGERDHVWIEVTHRRKDGTRYPVESVVQWLESGGGSKLLIQARDMSELHATREQLRQAQKMEALGQLSGGIAHDFNNLLTVIGGYTELLRSDRDSEELEEIARTVSRAAALTNQLLLFSRRSVVQPVDLDLNRVLAEAELLLRRVIGANVELSVEPASQPAFVRADPSQLQQIVMNLAVNARDAMPDGGRLTLETGRVEEEGPPRVFLAIGDTGSGIDAETQDHMFEPFFSTKGVAGTGLGLATVARIVQDLRGEIVVRSAVGEGTRFEVRLPRVADPVAQPLVDSGGSQAAGRGERILVVEDEEHVGRLIERLLRGAGYRVESVGHPSEAIELWAQRGGEFDLLVTDVVMPELSGRELAERLGTERVLFLSGYAPAGIFPEGEVPAGAAFLGKPFTQASLLAKVRGYLDEQQPDTGSGSSKGTLLVADDEAVIRKLTARLLTGEGYEVLTAEDGEQAVRIVREHADAIRLVILDALMPEKDGQAVCAELSAELPELRYLFSSGFGVDHFPAGYFDDPSRQLISKPFDPLDLIARVEAFLAQ